MSSSKFSLRQNAGRSRSPKRGPPNRKVLMIGPTGAGKSCIGNYLLESEVFPEAAAGSSWSETDTIWDSWPTFFDNLCLTVVDTPGLGDTEGRSIQFLNLIMQEIRKGEFHAIILVMNSEMKNGPELNYAFECLRQCSKPSQDSDISLPQGRVFLIVNKVPHPGFGYREKPEKEENIVQQREDFVTRTLEMQPGVARERIFVIKQDDPVAAHKIISNVREAIAALPDDPMPVKQFRTYIEVTNEADCLAANAISADEYAQRRIERLNDDIGWHKKRIEDLEIGIISTVWIPVAGWLAGSGMAMAIADSSHKIPVLERELRSVESNKHENLEIARRRAVAWQRKVANYQRAMAIVEK